MRTRRRYVFDTNVLVSALLFDRGKPGRAVLAALEEGELVVSPALVRELHDVLGREKFRRYVREDDRARFLASLVRDAVLIDPREETRVCRDPRDDKLLDLAASAGAACIVSGDNDLLILSPFRGIPVLTPDAFLSMLTTGEARG